MYQSYRSFLAVWLCLCCMWSLNGQDIIFSGLNSMQVCQSDQFTIIIQNTSGNTLANSTLQVTLPCFVEYETGSVQNANELNISNLSQPVFSLNDLAAGEDISVRLSLFTPCSTLDCIDNADIFNNQVTLTYMGGSVNRTTDNYNIVNALPLITDIDEPIIRAVKGEVVTRRVTIQNTRPGRLESFVFSDSYGEGLTIAALTGNVLTNANGLFELELSANEFQQVGNGDAYFDFNEVITIDEILTIDACGFETTFVRSDLDVEWGCRSETCDDPFEPQVALIDLDFEIEKGPILEFSSVLENPSCFCNQPGLEQSLSITNISSVHDAENIVVFINTIGYPMSAIDTKSIGLSTSQGVVNLIPFFDEDIRFECVVADSTQRTGFYVQIPQLATNESATLFWDVLFCGTEDCNTDSYYWDYDYSYVKACTVEDDAIHVGRDFARHDLPYTIFTDLSTGHNFEVGEQEYMELEVSTLIPNDKTGTIDITIEISCQLTVLEEEWLLGSQAPNSIQTENTEEGLLVSLSYDLPLENPEAVIRFLVEFTCSENCENTICSTVYNTSCSAPCASEIFLFDITTTASLNFEECNGECLIQYCDFNIYGYECPIEECIIDVPGYFDADFSLFRLNVGLPDNDNDHFPDPSGTLNYDSIRLDNLVTGDTLRALVAGRVQIDIPGNNFDRGFIEFKNRLITSRGFDPKVQFAEFAKLTEIDFGLPAVNIELAIYDESEDEWHYCENVPLLDQDSLGLSRYNLNLDVLRSEGCPIPLDYLYAANDSIIFLVDYKVNYNTESLLLNFGSMDIEFKNVNALYEGFVPEIDIFTCDCTNERVTIANYKSVITESLGRLDWCEGISEAIDLNIKYGSHSNYTPYEYKPTVQLSSFTAPAFETASLKSVQIISLFSNGERVFVNPQDPSTYIDVTIPTPNDARVNFPDNEPISGFYELDLLENLNLSWDDNIELRLRLVYQNEACFFNGNPNYFGTNRNVYSESIQNSNVKTDTTHKIGLLGKFLSMDLVPSICDVTSLSDTVSWDLEFRYNTIYPFENSEKEIELFLEAISPDGNLIPFEVIDIDNDIAYNYSGGRLILGKAMQSDSLNLQLRAVNLSCEEQDIKFRYGWICEGSSEPCQQKELDCTGVSPPGLIDMLVDTSKNEFTLCDTVELRHVHIFNAGLGRLTDIELLATLPPGMEVVEGSTQVIYPAGSGTVYNIGDPVEVAKNRYGWMINDTLVPFVLPGLPGVNDDPLNRFELVFKVISRCAFLSGSRIIFTTNGDLICNIESNAVSRISGPQTIEALDTSARVIITANNDFDYCKDQLALSYQLIPDNLFGPGDKLILQIPPGLNYIANSCLGNGSPCTPVIEDGLITIELAANEDTLNLELQISVDDSLACERVLIPAYTTASVNAFCASDATDCLIDYVTGEAIQQIDLDKPVFELSQIELSSDFISGSTEITIDISNVSLVDADSVVVSFYLDQDGSGTVSPGDILIEDVLVNQDISAGNILEFTYENQSLTADDLCQLLISIDEEKNCICKGDASSEFVKLIRNYNTIVACSGDSIQLGVVPMSGSLYSWSESENLSCSECPQTIFSFVNEGFAPRNFTYFLEVRDSASCTILYEFNVTVPPSLDIVTPPSTICQGDSIELIGPASSLYSWSFEGVEFSDERIVVVQPMASTTYTLLTQDSFGCQLSDTILIQVIDRPDANAGSDILACYGQMVGLSAENISDSLSYLWTPGFPFLEDPESPVTAVLINHDMDYVLTVANGQCVDADTVSVTFYDGLELTEPYEISVCLGETIDVQLESQYYYDWSPEFINFCQNDSCNAVSFTPQSDVLFEIIAQSEEGCLDTFNLNVIVNDTLTADTTQALICPGDSILWMGVWYDTEGTYCIELESDTLCQNQSCLNLAYYLPSTVEITASDTVVTAGELVDLEVSGSFNQYIWEDNPALSCLDCPDPIAEINQNEWFFLNAIDQNGCLVEDSIFIRVISDCIQDDFKIPNAFTPNFNNANDRFRVVGIESEEVDVSIEIYDRWGELLFEGFDNTGWDGRYDIEDAPEGVYLYLIRIQCPDEERILYKGDVTLIR